MEHIEHCDTEVASQGDLDTWIDTLWSKNESFNRQASKVQLDRDNEDLDELVSRQQEDEHRIAVRKDRDEQIVKKRKVEDEGHEQVRAALVEEAAVSWL